MPFVVPSSALVELPSRPPGEGLLQSRALQSILRTKLAAGERMRITAVAGAGKSTTLREYARANPALRTLYLTFNRSVKRAQAAAYAREHGLAHVEVRTLGSVAYEATKDVHEGDVRDAVDVRGALPAAPAEVVRAVGATLEAFFASEDAVVGRVHVDAAIAASARGAASDEGGDGGLVRLASTIWSKLGVTLAHTTSSLQKLFQLHYAARQPYDLVLLDEAHDCTRCEISAVLGMPGAAVVVYDARQCINQWRHAADMAFLSALRCEHSFFLGNSLRYGDAIAQKVGAFVNGIYEPDESFRLRGNASKTTSFESLESSVNFYEAAIASGASTAVLGLTNVTLVRAAFAATTRNPLLASKICFASGGAFAHVAPDGAAVLRELVAFASGEPVTIALLCRLAVSLNPMAALRAIARASSSPSERVDNADDEARDLCAADGDEIGDRVCDVYSDSGGDDDSSGDGDGGDGIDWRAALRLYDELGARRLCDAVAALESVPAATRTRPIEFSTVHKAKGREWPWVVLLDDFLLRETRHGLKSTSASRAIASNLAYVAMTRVQSRLFLRPSTFTALSNVRV